MTKTELFHKWIDEHGDAAFRFSNAREFYLSLGPVNADYVNSTVCKLLKKFADTVDYGLYRTKLAGPVKKTAKNSSAKSRKSRAKLCTFPRGRKCDPDCGGCCGGTTGPYATGKYVPPAIECSATGDGDIQEQGAWTVTWNPTKEETQKLTKKQAYDWTVPVLTGVIEHWNHAHGSGNPAHPQHLCVDFKNDLWMSFYRHVLNKPVHVCAADPVTPTEMAHAILESLLFSQYEKSLPDE